MLKGIHTKKPKINEKNLWNRVYILLNAGFSPWYSVTGNVGMAQSCIMAGLDWTMRSFSLLRDVVRQWNRLPRQMDDVPKGQFLRGTVPLIIGLKWSGSWVRHLL